VDFVTTPTTKYAEHRYLALGFQVDAIALTVAVAAPAAWYLAAGPTSRSRPPYLRLLNFAYMPLGIFALALTGTRGATLASIPTAVLVLWTLRRARHARILALGALAVTAVLIIQFAPREPLERIGTVSTTTQLSGEGALSGRWGIWQESRKAFLDRPIVGAGLAAHRAVVDTGTAAAIGEVKKQSDSLQVLAQGLDARRAAVATGREAHNAYLSVLVETGIVGFLLFANVILTVVAHVRQLSEWLAWYWSTQLAVIAIDAMSLSIEARKSVWILLALAVSSAAAAQRERVPADAPLTALTPSRAWS
jgi:O-antigen ligase